MSLTASHHAAIETSRQIGFIVSKQDRNDLFLGGVRQIHFKLRGHASEPPRYLCG
jgi:hypothetical protein